MEIPKPKPYSTVHQGTNQTTQTWTSHPSCGQLERSPSIQTSPIIHPENKTGGLTPQHAQSWKYYRPPKKTRKHPNSPQFTLASLDISNLYTNIPMKETRKIIANNLSNNNVNPQAQQELLNWYDAITSQNYFSN